MQSLVIGTTNLVEVSHLVNSVTGDYVDTATVTATIKDLQTGMPVDGETWPVTLVAVGTDGNYRVSVGPGLVLDRNRQYVVDITAVDGTETANWQTKVSAVVSEG